MYSLPVVFITFASLFCIYIAARVDLSQHAIRHVFYLHRIAGVIGCLLSIWDMYLLLSIDIDLLPRDSHGAPLVPSSVYTPYVMYAALIWFVLNAISSIPLLLRVHQQFHGVLRMLFVGCIANLIMPSLVFVYVVICATISTTPISTMVWILLTSAFIVIIGSLCILCALAITNTYHAYTPLPERNKPTIASSSTSISTSDASAMASASVSQHVSTPYIPHHSKDFSIAHFLSSMIRWMSSNGLPPWKEYESDIIISRYATIIGTITIFSWTIFIIMFARTYLNNTSNIMITPPATPAPIWNTSHISLSALLFTQVLHSSIFSNNISVFSLTMLFRGLVKRRIGLILYNLFSFPVPFILTAYLVASFGQSTSILDFILQQFAYQPMRQIGIIL